MAVRALTEHRHTRADRMHCKRRENLTDRIARQDLCVITLAVMSDLVLSEETTARCLVAEIPANLTREAIAGGVVLVRRHVLGVEIGEIPADRNTSWKLQIAAELNPTTTQLVEVDVLELGHARRGVDVTGRFDPNGV